MEKHMPWSGNGKKAEAAIFLSNKIDLKTNTIIRQRRTLHNDKGINPTNDINLLIFMHQHRNI